MILKMDVANNTDAKIHCGCYLCWSLHTEWQYIDELMLLDMVESKYMALMDITSNT